MQESLVTCRSQWFRVYAPGKPVFTPSHTAQLCCSTLYPGVEGKAVPLNLTLPSRNPHICVAILCMHLHGPKRNPNPEKGVTVTASSWTVQPSKDEGSVWLWDRRSCRSRQPVFKALGLFLFFPAWGKPCFHSVSGAQLKSKVKFFQDKFIVSDLGGGGGVEIFCAYL